MRKSNLTVVLLLLIMWGLLTLFIDRPFMGHHDANGIWLGSAARNLRLYGPAQMTWIPVLNRGPIPPATPDYYVNHPPLVVWLSALSESLFGEGELALRFVSAASTMIGLAGFYVLCRRLFGERRALLCLALYAFTPMIIYFGRMPNHEPLALAFVLPLAAIFVRWLRAPTPIRAGWLFLLTIGAVWSAWASVFFIVAFALVGWLFTRGRTRLIALALGAWSVLNALAIIGFYWLQNPDTLAILRSIFISRTGNVAFGEEAFSWGDFVATTLVHLVADLGLGLLILSLLGMVALWRDADHRRRALLFASGAAGLAYILVFRQVSYIHDYYKIFLTPFLAISAAYAIIWVWQRPRKQYYLRVLVAGLLIPSALFNVVILSHWYFTDRDDDNLRFARFVAANTSPEQTILTNIPFNPPVEYYAHRHMLQDVAPADAPAAAAGLADVVYLECDWVNTETTGVDFDPDDPGRGCVFRAP